MKNLLVLVYKFFHVAPRWIVLVFWAITSYALLQVSFILSVPIYIGLLAIVYYGKKDRKKFKKDTIGISLSSDSSRDNEIRDNSFYLDNSYLQKEERKNANFSKHRAR